MFYHPIWLQDWAAGKEKMGPELNYDGLSCTRLKRKVGEGGSSFSFLAREKRSKLRAQKKHPLIKEILRLWQCICHGVISFSRYVTLRWQCAADDWTRLFGLFNSRLSSAWAVCVLWRHSAVSEILNSPLSWSGDIQNSIKQHSLSIQTWTIYLAILTCGDAPEAWGPR